MQLVWSVADAEAAYATYIGRRGCKQILGIEVDATNIDQRITLTPVNVDNCQIDIPVQHLGKVIAMLQKVQKIAASRQSVGLMDKATKSGPSGV